MSITHKQLYAEKNIALKNEPFSAGSRSCGTLRAASPDPLRDMELGHETEGREWCKKIKGKIYLGRNDEAQRA